MRRHLLLTLVTVLGMLVWANVSLASTPDVLTLCVKHNGDIKADTTCKHGETKFNAISETALTELQDRVTALETLLAGVTRTASPDTLLLTGMNLQVVNGSGETDSLNSLGNIIIGYNTSCFFCPRSGSHNLVIGDEHTYTNTSGVVTGLGNVLTGAQSFVSGFHNTASGLDSFVGGGVDNRATDTYTFATGQGNSATYSNAFVSGMDNTASGVASFVAGGVGNEASGAFSFVGGSDGSFARGFTSFMGGGNAVNTAGGGFPCGYINGPLGPPCS